MTPDLRSPPSAPRARRLAAALAVALSTLAAAPWAAAAPANPAADAPATSPAAGDSITIESPTDSSASGASASAAPASSELADTQDKLATALRSYSLLQDENAQLKAAAEKSAADQADLARQLDEAHATIAALQSQAAAASQVAPLQAQVLEARDEGGRLAAENAALRTQLALQAPAPAADHPAPTRPGPAPVAAPQSEPAPAEGTAPASPAAERTYTVVEGDTLGKIALKFYGSASQWPKILAANHAKIPNENSLPVGAVLAIP